MTTHQLKTWPEAFQAVWEGRKPYEVRKADRPFQVGDLLVLREWVPCDGAMGSAGFGDYTGRWIRARVTYMTAPGEWGLPSDLCVLGVDVERVEVSRPDGDPCPSCSTGGWIPLHRNCILR